jgi:hypothetical protein
VAVWLLGESAAHRVDPIVSCEPVDDRVQLTVCPARENVWRTWCNLLRADATTFDQGRGPRHGEVAWRAGGDHRHEAVGVVAEVSRRSNRLRAEVLRLSALVESYRALVSGRSEADKARRINARPARCASLSGTPGASLMTVTRRDTASTTAPARS